MSYTDDKPNNWQAAEFDRHADVLTCSRCDRPVCEHEVDNDASEAFTHVCRECADTERAEAAAEDAQMRAAAHDAAEVQEQDGMRAKPVYDSFTAAADGIARVHFGDADVAVLQREGKLATMPRSPHSAPIATTFDHWWLTQGEFSWQQMHYRTPLRVMEAAREAARLAWLAGAGQGDGGGVVSVTDQLQRVWEQMDAELRPLNPLPAKDYLALTVNNRNGYVTPAEGKLQFHAYYGSGASFDAATLEELKAAIAAHDPVQARLNQIASLERELATLRASVAGVQEETAQ